MTDFGPKSVIRPFRRTVGIIRQMPRKLAIRAIASTQQDRLAVMGGVAWLIRQGLNLTPRRLGVVEVVSRSRVASLANPDASGRVLAGGGGAIAGAKTSEDATEEEHQGVTGRARALAKRSRGWAWGRSPAFTL